MTILVALKNNETDTIYFGSDTQGTSSYMIKDMGSKIFPLKIPILEDDDEDNKDDFITLWIGVSGNHFLQSYLKHSFLPPQIDIRWDFISYLYNQFFQQLQEELTLHKLLEDDNGVLNSGCELIIVYDGEIYNIFDDFSIVRVKEDYSCMGSGWIMGNAILHNLLEFHGEMSYEDMVIETMLTVADLNIYCNDEFIIEKIE